MKNAILALLVALVTTSSVKAQQIAVVSESGETTLYRTLQKAIEGALPGSVIYLPGGGFTIADSVKITNKLTIIGIGHKSNNDNVDGSTIISGNLFFNEGSSGSAVMACYITGNVNIGEGGASVNDVLIRYCNLNSISVRNSTCMETIVNQNYIRSTSDFGTSNAYITNNIVHSIYGVNGGMILNNIVTDEAKTWSSGWCYQYGIWADFSTISYNVIFVGGGGGGNWSRENVRGNGNMGTDNMVSKSFGENCISLGGSWNDLFENIAGVSLSSNFHFKEDYKKYENQVGIYAGTGFHDEQMAPVPRIIAKSIPEQTDASGKLNIKIRVKAGE